MTIEIHEPELIQALKYAHLPETKEASGRTGTDLLTAMQRSPYKEVDLEPSRPHLPVRDVVL